MDDLLGRLQELDGNRPSEVKDKIETLLTLRAVADLARSIAKELGLELAKELESRGMVTESFGRYTIQARRDAKRVWDHPRLLARVLQYADENGYEAHQTLQRVAAFSYWRLGELKKLGFDHRHFCDEVWETTGVDVVEGGSPTNP